MMRDRQHAVFSAHVMTVSELLHITSGIHFFSVIVSSSHIGLEPRLPHHLIKEPVVG
jgi:hypothetical protein